MCSFLLSGFHCKVIHQHVGLLTHFSRSTALGIVPSEINKGEGSSTQTLVIFPPSRIIWMKGRIHTHVLQLGEWGSRLHQMYISLSTEICYWENCQYCSSINLAQLQIPTGLKSSCTRSKHEVTEELMCGEERGWQPSSPPQIHPHT